MKITVSKNNEKIAREREITVMEAGFVASKHLHGRERQRPPIPITVLIVKGWEF